MTFTPQNFKDGVGPAASANWLNGIDVTVNSILGGAQTVPAAQAALGLPTVPLPVSQGGVTATNGTNILFFGTDSGIVNECVVAADGLPATVAPGTALQFIPAVTNTGASTINGAPIVNQEGDALTGGELSNTGPVLVIYNGIHWQILASSQTTLPNPVTANEIAAGVTPLNFNYTEGYFLRYISSWASNQADTASANTNALNNATKVAAIGKNPVILPAGNINITATWNCSATNAALTGTNGGLKVKGQGVANTTITYAAGANNTGNAWDMVGCSYGSFEGFTFIGGAVTAPSYSNSPNVTLLMGSGTLVGSFTGSITGNVLTCSVPPTNYALGVGQSITGSGTGGTIPANTTISSLGTGTGGTGTYILNNSAGSPVTSETMTNTGGRLYSIGISFNDVQFVACGDIGIYNAGAEQVDFFNCFGQFLRGPSFTNARPIIFCTEGTSPTVSSAFTQIEETVISMTDVHWHGAKGALIFQGPYGVVFQFSGTTSGSCADIRFDGYIQTNTATGTFRFFTDTSNGIASTLISDCGGDKIILENPTTNGAVQMCYLNAAICSQIRFRGKGASGAISAAPFQFTSTAFLEDYEFDWNPNESGTFSGGFILIVAGSEGGGRIKCTLPASQLAAITSTHSVGGFQGYGYLGSASDYGLTTGATLVQGPTSNGQFNLTRTVKAGNRVNSNSDYTEGVWTTPAVSTTTPIITFPGTACLFHVTGTNSGGAKFYDIVCGLYGGTPMVVASSNNAVSPAGRTYTITGSNVLNLAMASGTYAIQVLCQQIGAQA